MQLASTQEFLFVKIVLSNLSLATLTSIMQLVESKADENFNWDYYKKVQTIMFHLIHLFLYLFFLVLFLQLIYNIFLNKYTALWK